MKVRVRDIAREAGVSAASVSNALNGRGGVGEETAKRILSIARDMGYTFDKSASHRKNYVKLVVFKRHGLVVMDTQFFAEMMEALERECHQIGLQMVVAHIHMEKDADYHARIRDICQEDCAGILLLATEMFADDLDLFMKTKAPLLVIDSMFQTKKVNCVVMNNFEAGHLATEHLIQMGHTHIEHITSTVRFNNMRFRRVGFEAAMVERHLPIGEGAIWRVTPTIEGAYRDMYALIDRRTAPMPTAFFAANDIIAFGAMRALKERGIDVPQDVSIIGMDDLTICQIANPALSTIRVFREDIARIAIQRLVQMLDESASRCVQKTEVSVELVDRKSVADLNDM